LQFPLFKKKWSWHSSSTKNINVIILSKRVIVMWKHSCVKYTCHDKSFFFGWKFAQMWKVKWEYFILFYYRKIH
jgi:hypothetical protein